MCHKSQNLFYSTVIHLIWKLCSIIQSAFSCLCKKISMKPPVTSQVTYFPIFLPDLKYPSLSFIIRWPETVDILATATGVCQFLKLLSFPLRWCYFRYIPKALKKTFHSLLPNQIMAPASKLLRTHCSSGFYLLGTCVRLSLIPVWEELKYWLRVLQSWNWKWKWFLSRSKHSGCLGVRLIIFPANLMWKGFHHPFRPPWSLTYT